MRDKTTPETDAAERMAYSQEYMVPTEFARKLERERDEAIVARKASAADWLNQLQNANQRTINAEKRAASLGLALDQARKERDEARDKYDTLAVENMLEVHRLCKECDEARKSAENSKSYKRVLKKTNARLKRECDKARAEAVSYEAMLNIARENAEEWKAECTKLREAILYALEENRHLADGDDCTLAKLKSVVPDWK